MKLFLYFFGYVTFKVKESDVANAAGALLRRGLSGSFDGDGYLTVPYLRRKLYKRALGKTEFCEVGSGGALVRILSLRKRWGIYAALAILTLYYAFVSGFIWDVRVFGNEELSEYAVLEELEAAGLSVGTSWRSASLDSLERAVLESSDNIGWINVNRRGSVAYVTVKEKKLYDEGEEAIKFSNVVASCDAVIEEITVRSGIACVKAGDTVKAGDLLISGIIPSELGGGFVRASGEVYGRAMEKISLEVEREESYLDYQEPRLKSARINIFKLSVNIFKSYRKSGNECVIIEDMIGLNLPGGYRLPVKIVRIYEQQVLTERRSYTDAMLVSVASSRLSALRSSRLAGCELLGLKTYGEFTDKGYKMTSEAVTLMQIGEEKEFAEALEK